MQVISWPASNIVEKSSAGAAVQACSGLLQLMRENGAAGATFCRLLVTQLEAGHDVMPIDSLLELARLLLDHLLQVPIIKAKAKKKKAKKKKDGADREGALPGRLKPERHWVQCARGKVCS